MVVLAFPRVVLAGMWFFTHMIGRAYDGALVPLLGFFFMPITTIAYSWLAGGPATAQPLILPQRPIEGINLVILIAAVVLDLGSHNGGRQYYRR